MVDLLAEAEGRRKSRAPVLWPALALVALTVIAFCPAFSNGYVNFDDSLYIEVNPNLNDAAGLVRIWTPTPGTKYYPLVFTSFWLEKQAQLALGIIKPDQPPLPSVNHGINILLHAACGVLLWRCLVHLGMTPLLAWLAAAVWLLHPLQVQSVVWAVERKNTLSTVLCLASALLWLESEKRPLSFDMLASILLFALAMLAKTASMLLPLTLLLTPWLRGRSVRPATFLAVAPHLFVAVLFIAVTLNTQTRGPGVEVQPLFVRMLFAAMALSEYLSKFIVPVGITATYERWESAVTTPRIVIFGFWAAAAVAWLAAAFIARPQHSRPLAVALVATIHFVAVLAPTLGLIAYGHPDLSLVLNHHVYLALAAPAVVLVLLLERISRGLGPPPRIAAAALLVIALAALAGWRSTAWRDTMTLANDIMRYSPNSARGYSLIAFELGPKKPDEALKYMQRAVDLAPKLLETRFRLAWLLAQAGRRDEAVSHLQAVLAVDPDYPGARLQLAHALMQQRKFAEALAQIDAAGPGERAHPAVRHARATCLRELNRPDEAMEEIRRGLAAQPTNANLLELGVRIYLDVNRPADGEALCTSVLEQAPRHVPALLMRARCRVLAGNRAAAEQDLRAAVAIDRRAAPQAEAIRRLRPPN